MAFVIAQISDVHIGGPTSGSGERFSTAIAEINAMHRQPDLVLITGDLTHESTADEYAEFRRRLEDLAAHWTAIAGNHDRLLTDLAGHRTIDAGPIQLVLLDTSHDLFSADDAAWLDAELRSIEGRVAIAMHHPPFETGIWWMDCVGMAGGDTFERVVADHDHVELVMCGHVHRPIHAMVGGSPVFVCPSTSVAVAGDLSPAHAPAESDEGPMIALHAFTDRGPVTHVLPVGPAAQRTPIVEQSGGFLDWVRAKNDERPSLFS